MYVPYDEGVCEHGLCPDVVSGLVEDEGLVAQRPVHAEGALQRVAGQAVGPAGHAREGGRAKLRERGRVN